MLGGPDAKTPAVVDNVLNERANDDGRLVGWKARVQYAPRLETPPTAMDALLHAGVPVPVDDVIRMLRNLLDDTALQRPFILTTALGPLLRVASDSTLAPELVQRPAGHSDRGRRAQTVAGEAALQSRPTVARTVGGPHRPRGDGPPRGAPGTCRRCGDLAEQWLATADDINGVTEIIRRLVGDRQLEQLTFDHFTSAWVARALAGGAAPDRRRIIHALDFVWNRFDSDRNLWAWGNGDTPVWMFADAVAALQESAFALLPGLPSAGRRLPPGSRPATMIPPARSPGSGPCTHLS